MQRPRIFVSIASYRDSECPATITDLFAKAQSPERVFAGVLWQIVPEFDMGLVGGKAPKGHLRTLLIHAGESRGVCWARSRILTELRKDEEYVLQIDSHTRFAPDWDDRLLAMLKDCATPKAVLTCHPIPYVPPHELAAPAIPVTQPKGFNEQGILTINSRSIPYTERPIQPVPAPFVGAGCLFAPAAAFDEVPYDPHLYFQGEEPTLSARLWTNGWDLYAPNDVLLYHDYTQDRGRPKHWRDHRDWTRINALSFARIRYLLAGEMPVDSKALTEVERYGLGNTRSLAAFEAMAGVDFKTHTLKAVHP